MSSRTTRRTTLPRRRGARRRLNDLDPTRPLVWMNADYVLLNLADRPAFKHALVDRLTRVHRTGRDQCERLGLLARNDTHGRDLVSLEPSPSVLAKVGGCRPAAGPAGAGGNRE